MLRGAFAAAQLAELRSAHQGSDEHDAGRARAQELLRAAGGVSGREVARDRDRIRIAGRRACRARRQRHRRGLSRPAADRQAGVRPARPGCGSAGEIETLAQEGRRRRGEGRAISRQAPICSSAPTTRRCRTSSSANSTPSLASARAQKSDAEAQGPTSSAKLCDRGGAIGILRDHQFRAAAPAVGAARDAARAACRAVVDLARTSIRASRNCARRSPISSGRCAARPTGWRARSRTTPSSPAPGRGA